jgi:HK97 family phage major capsid protein
MSDETRVDVIAEPLTYRRDGEHSYFKDRLSDRQDARERLKRHAQEMDVEIPERDKVARARADAQGLEFRVNPNRAQGQGGFFAPPLWVLDAFAGVPRLPRVLADLVPHFDLPAGVQSVNLPCLLTGDQTAPVADDMSDVDVDVVDAAVSSPVVTIAGQGIIAQQLIDQSPAGARADYAFFKDLAESYDEQLEQQIIYGSGTAGQFYGISTIAGITLDSYTAATPAAGAMYTAWCALIGAVADARKHHPEAFLVRTGRWMWLAAQGDTQGRPFIPPMPSDADEPPVNTIRSHGKVGGAIRAYLDEAISISLGTGMNQDEVIACTPSDLMLFEGTPRISVNVDAAVSGNLQARLVFSNYAAFIAGRYPSGIGTLTGTGFVYPTAAGF